MHSQCSSEILQPPSDEEVLGLLHQDFLSLPPLRLAHKVKEAVEFTDPMRMVEIRQLHESHSSKHSFRKSGETHDEAVESVVSNRRDMHRALVDILHSDTKGIGTGLERTARTRSIKEESSSLSGNAKNAAVTKSARATQVSPVTTINSSLSSYCTEGAETAKKGLLSSIDWWKTIRLLISTIRRSK